MRFTVLPAIAALAFVPRIAFRPLVDATPVRARRTTCGQTFLALPLVALTCWAQWLLIRPQAAPSGPPRAPATYPLVAEIIGWCALTLAAAACTDRSRYADLGGAVAAPISLALIALATHGPQISRLLDTPPANPQTATAAWYGITSAAIPLTYLAIRDRWHRYIRILRRTRTLR